MKISQDVFCVHFTKILIPSIVIPEINLRCSAEWRCIRFVKHQTGSSPHPLFCCCGTATASSLSFPPSPSSRWVPPGTSTELMMPPEDERSVPEEEEKKRFHINRVISALKQWWGLFLDVSVIAAWKSVQMGDFTSFSLHFHPFSMISYLYQVHTHYEKRN